MSRRTWADLVATDREGRPVVLVEAKAGVVHPDVVAWFLEVLSDAPETIRFGIFALPDVIRIFRRGETEPALVLDAVEVLRYYSPTYDGERTPYGHKLLLARHVEALVGAWLRDLAYRWKPGRPPGLEELESIGLLGLIEGGSTADGVDIGGAAVR